MKTDLTKFDCDKDIGIFVQTAQVLSAFLLMVGKRADGRRVLLELFHSIINIGELQVELQVELILELAQASWLDHQMDSLLTPNVINHLFQLRSVINDETSPELSESLSIALYIIGAGLVAHNKMHIALDAGFEEDDFDLDDFVNDRMSGSADDFYRHSMSKVAVCAKQASTMRSASLRYCVQIHTSLLSTLTERSFYQNLFATNMPIAGAIKMPLFGRDLLNVCRQAEKVFWYTHTMVDEFMARGFTTEVELIYY